MSMFDYKSIFEAIESSLLDYSTHPDLQAVLDEYKYGVQRVFSDEEYFRHLVQVVFYSGIRAETVTSRLKTIYEYFPDYETAAQYHDLKPMLENAMMLRSERKIKACISNGQEFGKIIEKHGSFAQYLAQFQPEKSFENLMLLKEELEYRFSGLGTITTYHFMTEIGLPVLKPDVVICRIFKRLGLIENEQQLLKTVIQGRKFAEATEHSIRYIDIVLVTYGQVTTPGWGIQRGICVEKPQCHFCQAQPFCTYFKSHSINGSLEGSPTRRG